MIYDIEAVLWIKEHAEDIDKALSTSNGQMIIDMLRSDENDDVGPWYVGDITRFLLENVYGDWPHFLTNVPLCLLQEHKILLPRLPENLKDVLWPQTGPECIPDKMFSDFCDTISSFNSEKTDLKYIGKEAFYDCKVSKIDLASCDVIKSEAFFFCSKLTELSIPDGCTRIEDKAFGECENLPYVELPQSVKYIGSGITCDIGKSGYVVGHTKIKIRGLDTLQAQDWLLTRVTTPNEAEKRRLIKKLI